MNGDGIGNLYLNGLWYCYTINAFAFVLRINLLPRTPIDNTIYLSFNIQPLFNFHPI